MEEIHRLIKLFKKLSPHMTTLQMQLLLTVALHPGEGTLAYARRLNVSAAVMSHLISRLGERGRPRQNETVTPGLRLLVQKPSPTDRRATEVYLTPKGVRLVRQLVEEVVY